MVLQLFTALYTAIHKPGVNERCHTKTVPYGDMKELSKLVNIQLRRVFYESLEVSFSYPMNLDIQYLPHCGNRRCNSIRKWHFQAFVVFLYGPHICLLGHYNFEYYGNEMNTNFCVPCLKCLYIARRMQSLVSLYFPKWIGRSMPEHKWPHTFFWRINSINRSDL